MSEFVGRRILVVGLGVSGFSAARALLKLDAKVRVTESNSGPAVQQRADALTALGVEVEIGGHDLALLDADLAILSPGVPPTAPVVLALRDAGIEAFSEVELAYRLGQCDFLAVTGTNGKTTTTSLLAAILEEAGVPTAAAGNIGFPLIDAIAGVPSGGAIALEVSSFQLAAIERFRPKVAVLLNVAEDHTDWHGSFRDYADAKARIVSNQTGDDIFLPNADDDEAMAVAARTAARVVPFSAARSISEGVGVETGSVLWRGDPIISVSDVPLPGIAGLEDVAAATGAALEYGIDPKPVVRAVMGFRPLAHRLEVVAEYDGVTYIDDSKATNPHATQAAVKGLKDVVLIAGGRSKGIDLSALATTVPPVIAVVALGEARTEVEEVFDGLVPVDSVNSMSEAVDRAAARSVRGGSVLLSPGCASLDMYESYVVRGEDFARSVKELIRTRAEGGNDGD
ncbi:MAG: UDP-N-acetylmuramoyl-L-alanine--D-glutamate ligase [Actinomycetota bacterium]